MKIIGFMSFLPQHIEISTFINSKTRRQPGFKYFFGFSPAAQIYKKLCGMENLSAPPGVKCISNIIAKSFPIQNGKVFIDDPSRLVNILKEGGLSPIGFIEEKPLQNEILSTEMKEE